MIRVHVTDKMYQMLIVNYHSMLLTSLSRIMRSYVPANTISTEGERRLRQSGCVTSSTASIPTFTPDQFRQFDERPVGDTAGAIAQFRSAYPGV